MKRLTRATQRVLSGARLHPRRSVFVALAIVLLPLTAAAIWGAAIRSNALADAEPDATPINLTIEPAPRPVKSMAFSEGCVTPECHARYITAATQHAPVEQDRCDFCHEEDAGDHTFAPTDDPVSLCLECHEVGRQGLFQHAALTTEGCLACHDPHASEHAHLLTRGTMTETCDGCHDRSRGSWIHDPYESGQCEACHEPHESNFESLVVGGAGNDHCRNCHEPIAHILEAADGNHADLDSGCMACHGPHSADYENLLIANTGELCLSCHEDVRAEIHDATVSHAALLGQKRCLVCHDAHGSYQPHLLRDQQASLCLECHNVPVLAADGRTIPDMAPAIIGAEFAHGPLRLGNCSSCHRVHGSENARLLSEETLLNLPGQFDVDNYSLCFGCHDDQLVLNETTEVTTQFRDGDLNLHRVHIKAGGRSRTCMMCHAVHGSNNARHIAETVAYDGSDWLMKIGFVLNENGGSCSPGCHEPVTYRRNPSESPEESRSDQP